MESKQRATQMGPQMDPPTKMQRPTGAHFVEGSFHCFPRRSRPLRWSFFESSFLRVFSPFPFSDPCREGRYLPGPPSFPRAHPPSPSIWVAFRSSSGDAARPKPQVDSFSYKLSQSVLGGTRADPTSRGFFAPGECPFFLPSCLLKRAQKRRAPKTILRDLCGPVLTFSGPLPLRRPQEGHPRPSFPASLLNDSRKRLAIVCPCNRCARDGV